MDLSLLEGVLRCPYCGGTFRGAGTDPISNKMEYGILTCYCSRFPVVAGIPILKRDNTTEEVIDLVEDGRQLDAIFTLIQPGSMSMPPIWKLSAYFPYGNRLRGLAHQKRLQEWRTRFAALLLRMDREDHVTVCELLDCYFDNKELYNYYAFRFGQARHLVALSVASVIRQPTAMILDFGCGQGHITRSLVCQASGQQVIGIDSKFWELYVAKRWVAPEGKYICCSADNAFPFANKVFSAAFCSDAFMYIKNKRSCVQELSRIINEGVIILTGVRNKFIKNSHEGIPLPPEGYHALFHDLPHRIVADEDILERYLRKEGPKFSLQPETAFLNQKPLLTIMASIQKDVFRDYGTFEKTPHANGQLAINPLYVVVAGSKGKIILHRKFPSRFYEEDHPEYKQFMPATIELDATILNDLASGKKTTAIEKLIDQFIVLGMPENFINAPQLIS